jgi:predicted enzyme related to lactoylglutathione lyase
MVLIWRILGTQGIAAPATVDARKTFDPASIVDSRGRFVARLTRPRGSSGEIVTTPSLFPARRRRRRPGVVVSVALLLALTSAASPPSGAASVLPPLSDPATGTHIPGKFIWFDLATADPAAAQRFYGAVFSWEFEALRGSPEKYVVIRNEGRPIAGVFRPAAAATSGKAAATRWLSFASVADIGRGLANMTANGATVLVPATRVPGRGTHALVRDAQGALVGLLQSASGDRPDDPVPPGDFFWVDLYARDPVAAGRSYEKIGYGLSTDEVSGDERLMLSAQGYARAGIVRLPAEGREAGWLPYVQVEDVPAALERVRAAGGKVLREPDPKILGGQVAVFADPLGGVLGVIHWVPASGAGEKQP